MKLKTVDPVSSAPVQATFGFGGPDAMPIPPASPDSRAASLLPYEKVAKAIYVRANGLPAYHRTTGHIRRFSDGGESETK